MMDDKLYEQAKGAVEEAVKALSRAKEAQGNKKDSTEYLRQVQSSLSGLRSNVIETIGPGWKMDAVFQMIDGATQIPSNTKLPGPTKNLLASIDSGDINWALKHLKIEWVRFNQLYAQKWFEDKVRDARNDD